MEDASALPLNVMGPTSVETTVMNQHARQVRTIILEPIILYGITIE